jgi:hypothetical protein
MHGAGAGLAFAVGVHIHKQSDLLHDRFSRWCPAASHRDPQRVISTPQESSQKMSVLPPSPGSRRRPGVPSVDVKTLLKVKSALEPALNELGGVGLASASRSLAAPLECPAAIGIHRRPLWGATSPPAAPAAERVVLAPRESWPAPRHHSAIAGRHCGAWRRQVPHENAVPHAVSHSIPRDVVPTATRSGPASFGRSRRQPPARA